MPTHFKDQIRRLSKSWLSTDFMSDKEIKNNPVKLQNFISYCGHIKSFFFRLEI